MGLPAELNTQGTLKAESGAHAVWEVSPPFGAQEM